MTPIKTIKQFNAALKAAGVPLELVKGEGYFYFPMTEDGVEVPSIMVYAFSQMHPELWAVELANAVEFYQKNRPAQIGRPAELEGGRRRNVYLDDQSWAIAEALGGGNISKGLRLALKAAKQ